jgi:predicted nucleic acid-binding protein
MSFMTEICFVDTNILVYFRDASEPEKQRLAASWLAHLWRQRLGRLSFQVLNEYYVAVTQRLTPGLDCDSARSDVRNLMKWQPVSVDQVVIEGAWAVQDRYHLSWWDALIVSAAQKARCAYLLSEDLRDGQRMDGVEVVNPFVRSPEGIS